MYYKRGKKYYSFAGVLLVLSILLLFGGCEKKKVKSESIIGNAANASGEPDFDTSFLGTVKERNEIAKTITLYNIDEKEEITLNYTGGTDVKDQYEQVISMNQIDLGEMVDVYCVKETDRLVKLQISNHAWEYQGVDKMDIDKSNKIIKIADRQYQYNEKLVIAGEDGPMSLIDLNDRDELTVKGVAGKIYSIFVTKGHGYIRITNYDDFIGGTIEVGYGIIMPVTENMLIVAREGSYKVTMENGELKGSRNVTVTRNKEITLDMGDFRIKKERIGTVNFVVSPEGADLYINGTLVDYSEPIELNYGEHDVLVQLAGYEDFVGILKVGAAYQTISINLAAATAEVVDQAGDTGGTGDSTGGGSETIPGDTNGGNNSTAAPVQSEEPEESDGTDITTGNSDNETVNTGTTKTDSDHTITVAAPAGAKVYLNGVLKGTAPVTFVKEIGTHILTFSMDNYITKSYTIEVADDSENVTFTFADLIKITQ